MSKTTGTKLLLNESFTASVVALLIDGVTPKLEHSLGPVSAFSRLAAAASTALFPIKGILNREPSMIGGGSDILFGGEIHDLSLFLVYRGSVLYKSH